jgi:DNA-binding IclR family transcriptional regulator
MARPLPPAVVDFVYRYVESLEVLEVLQRLQANPARPSSAEQIVAECGLPVTQVSDVLAGFLYKGLVTFSDGLYRFHPRDRELASGAAAFARAYRETPTAVIREVASLKSARSFADAFRLRSQRRSKNG